MISLETLYRSAGFITGTLLHPSEITLLRQGSDHLHQTAATMTRTDGDFNLEAAGGGYRGQQIEVSSIAGVLRKVSNVIDHSPAAAQIADRRDLRQLAATLTGAGHRGVTLAHSILWCKPPGVGSAKPPHADAAYLEGKPDDYVTFWIALDDCDTENGCLQVIPTSHLHDYEHVSDEPQVPDTLWQSLSRMDVLLHPGWAIAFHPRLLHASAANTSTRPRRALMLRYQAW